MFMNILHYSAEKEGRVRHFLHSCPAPASVVPSPDALQDVQEERLPAGHLKVGGPQTAQDIAEANVSTGGTQVTFNLRSKLRMSPRGPALRPRGSGRSGSCGRSRPQRGGGRGSPAWALSGCRGSSGPGKERGE